MKHHKILRPFAALSLAAVLAVTVYAYMFHRTQTINNSFTPAQVTCEVHEAFDDQARKELSGRAEMISKKEIVVKNTSNIPAFIRVRLAFHWEDSKGNTVARPPREAVFDLGENWVKLDNYTYCYKYPVDPGAFTGNLLKANTEIKLTMVSEAEYIKNAKGEIVETIYYHYYPVMEVLAEAIQYLPDDAVEEAWGVNVSTDTDGQRFLSHP